MSADLLVIVPSRERPQNIDSLVGAWRETSAGHADLIVALDDDEPMDYPVLDDVLYVHGPRQQLCGWTNTIATQHAGRYRYLGSIGDDHRPRTRHWDAVICDALADLGTGIVYGDDLLRGAELCTAAFMTSDIVLRLGYMCPPGFVHLDVDRAWMALGRGIERLRYLPDVVIEHVHPLAHKTDWDDSYRASNSPERVRDDRAALDRYCASRLMKDVASLRGILR